MEYHQEQPTTEQIISTKQQAFIDIASKEKLVTWQEESQFAIEAIQNNKVLRECSHASIQSAIINVAACGLTLNPARGLAYLVPEYDKATEQQQCKLRISFKGLMKVAIDSGAIDYAKAEVVRENDTFDYLGPCEKPGHNMNPFCKNRGAVVGVYCIAKTAKGDFLCDVMSKLEIDHIKRKAKTKYVWDDWYEEMAKKAIIKRSSKQWPSGSTTRLANTINHINDLEGSEKEINAKIVNDPNQLPQSLAIEYYEQSDFQQLFPQWKKVIQSGNKPANDLITFVESKGRKLTEQQKMAIQEVKL